MNNLSLYCGLVDAKKRASDKDLPVLTGMYSSILPPAKTPKSFGPSFLSESMVKITFSITIPVIK